MVAFNTRLAHKRAKFADAWIPKTAAAARAAFAGAVKDAVAIVRDGGADLSSIVPSCAADLRKREFPLLVAMTISGYKLAEVELGKSNMAGYVAAMMQTDAFDRAKKATVPGPGDIPEELINTRLQANVARYSDEFTNYTAKTVRKRLDTIVQIGRTRELPINRIAALLVSEGKTILARHAKVVARTSTIWCYNEGAVSAYADEGFQSKVWLTTEDDMTCEFCSEMNGRVVEITGSFFEAGEKFSVANPETGANLSYTNTFICEHPPLHPNCRCAIVPA